MHRDLAQLLRLHRPAARRPRRSLPGRTARFALLRLDRLFQIERLHAFNRKFFPEWRARYVCFERLADAPAVGLAYLRAESLLTLPGPWTRRREREPVPS